tara:strand:- start:398 stop:1744 length:1347 start_codon:yes stop_codon:yes gene_type:complete
MQEKLASKNIVLKKITTNDANRKYLSWFKERQTKRFIENSKSIKNILDLKKNIKFESSKENSYFFKIITKSGIHIGNVKIENNTNTNTSTLGILIGEKKWRGKKILNEVSDILSNWLFRNFSITNLNSGSDIKNLSSIKGFLNSNYRIVSKSKKIIKFNKNYLLSKLIIGTANFGKIYGFNDAIKKINIKSIEKKLLENNFSHFDTSKNYNSEKVIGKLPKSLKTKIITKININPEKINKFSIVSQVKKSLVDCKVRELEGLLIHNQDIVFDKRFHKVISIFKYMKNKGLVKKIGISIYDFEILRKYEKKLKSLDVINLPYNIFDRRLEKREIIKIIKRNNFEIHARSVFLQGILTKKFKKLPSFFVQWKKHFIKWENFLKKNKISAYEFCLLFVLKNQLISKIIVGFENKKQLNNFTTIKLRKIKNMPKFNISKNSNLIRPDLWATN